MKILLVPDSYKGTLSSLQVINHIETAAKKHFSDLEIIKVPIADGGEGTVEALLTASGGDSRTVSVTGPLGKKVTAVYGIINGKTAIIEIAQASGLPLLSSNERNPLITTTFGTGELIKCVLDRGIRDIIIGIGGSATNDGGMGAAQALGVKYLDNEGNNVGFGGQYLSKVVSIDTSGIDQRLKESTITVICDVSNPLTGPRGATHIFGPQKGADDEQLKILEAGMLNYSEVSRKHLGFDIDNIPGAGAAGGLGAALVGFLGATLKSGIETILDFVQFDKLLNGVDLVITGEGRIDGQSIFGKVPVGVASHCKRRNIPVAAIVGGMGKEAGAVYDYGIDSIMPTVNTAMPLDEALSRADELLLDAADRLFRFVKIGMKITK